MYLPEYIVVLQEIHLNKNICKLNFEVISNITERILFKILNKQSSKFREEIKGVKIFNENILRSVIWF
jgi:hypothetical protein